MSTIVCFEEFELPDDDVVMTSFDLGVQGAGNACVIDVDSLDCEMDLTQQMQCPRCGDVCSYDVCIHYELAWESEMPATVPFIDDTQLYDWFLLGTPLVLLRLIALIRGTVEACNASFRVRVLLLSVWLVHTGTGINPMKPLRASFKFFSMSLKDTASERSMKHPSTAYTDSDRRH